MDIGAIGNLATNAQRPLEAKQPNLAPPVTSVKAAPVQTTDAVQRSAATPSTDQVKQAVKDINKSMQSLSQGLEFSIDADSKQNVVKVIDPQTKEVIRQMPSEEAIEIAKALDQMIGKLIKEKV
ncbi:flagellar protein FlaG [Undibacterium piscinae]|uniref:Flagellar protein FlaG n=1 Tax=Undibacterium piscinae TaxID=2495591 RepID=A0A6M4A0J3_9BURK|nr:flagellar protein FlaG [Undibacterium piscinae]